MFMQSGAVAIAASELAGLLARYCTRLTPQQRAWLQAIVAALSGGTTAVATYDPLGGAVTIGVTIGHLQRTNLPPEIKRALVSLAALLGPLGLLGSPVPGNGGLPPFGG